MQNELEYKCPNCTAILKFNNEGKCKCEYCRDEFSINDLECMQNKIIGHHILKNMNIYTCSDCGESIIVNSNININSCIYCKSVKILKNKFDNTLNPDLMIPFKICREDAIKCFKNVFKRKIFKPNNFKIKEIKKEICGIYIPVSLYDFSTNGKINAECKCITSWKNGVNKYIKSDIYKTEFCGNMFSYNMIVDYSTFFSNKILNLLMPYDFEHLEKINSSYLLNYVIEKPNLTKNEFLNKVSEIVKNTFIDKIKEDMKDYEIITPISNDIKLNKQKEFCILLPVWVLNIKTKDKIYTLSINGQTCKIVEDIPTDIKKIILVWFLIFIISFIVLLGINYVGGII